jgi:glycosyltransferase involved in cell wall biosynthesis
VARALISFVVPAFNEARYLGDTLAAIHGAASELALDYEIVVADDASTDATGAVAAGGGAKVVRVDKRQIAATRNAGAAAAGGERLVFVDADTRIDAAVLRAAMDALDAGAVGGGAGVRLDAAPRWAHAFTRVLLTTFRWLGLAAGCFVFCTRRAFDAAGGFDESYFGAEEIVISRALARQGRFVVLRESVLTSGRKLEGRSAWQVFRITAGIIARGRRGVRRREGMEFWYGERR